MARHIPTPAEQEAIEFLTLRGYVVVRQRSYADLRERLRIAGCMEQMERERRESVEAWARRECDEQRRLSRRLNEVCYAATSLGVPIQAINTALNEVQS